MQRPIRLYVSLFAVVTTSFVLHAQYSLRFYGNGVNAPDADRVKIQIDDISNNEPGPPVDIGNSDFTIEFWMKGDPNNNTSDSVSCGLNNHWIYGNIIIDRDRYNQDQNYGVSVAGGLIVFGVAGEGTGFMTICGKTPVLDNQWHHIALQRRRSDGYLWLYVDGGLEDEVDGPDGDISYPDDGTPCSTCCNGSACDFSDPFIVLAAEKHDAGASFPSFNGQMDELRFSDVLRYNGPFTPSDVPFATDLNTMALYHFDEGSGAILGDQSGAIGGPSHGQINLGGTPAGPVWVLDSPLSCSSLATNSWTSISASDWHASPSNWSLNTIPALCDQVVIGMNGQVVVSAGQTALAVSLQIDLGAQFEILPGAQLVVH